MTFFHAVQIGAHRGDEFAAAAAAGAPCLLVEPVPRLYQRLVQRFANLPNVRIENLAIAGAAGRRRFFYLEDRPELPSWADQIASLDAAHITTLAEQECFPDSWRQALIESTVDCLTLDQLCARHGVSGIDTLLVDAEGLDYAILIDFDFSRVELRRIIFERKHTDGVRRTERRYNHLIDRLRQLGYATSRSDSQNVLAVLTIPFPAVAKRLARCRAEEGDSLAAALPPAPAAPRLTAEETGTGVVFLATDQAEQHACRRAIALLRWLDPGRPITLFSAEPPADDPVVEHRPIDEAGDPAELWCDALRQSPYDRSVFLAPDSWVVGRIDELFAGLDRADWALAPAPDIRFHDGDLVFEGWERADTFDPGVIAFRRNDAVLRHLERWTAARRSEAGLAAGAFAGQRLLRLDNRRWALPTTALGIARREGLLPEARIIRGAIWEARQYWAMDLPAIVMAALLSAREAAPLRRPGTRRRIEDLLAAGRRALFG